MPTSKPRVIVTLDPETHRAIQLWASLQGVSRGRVISDFMDSIAPVLGRSAELMQAAKDAPDEVKARLVESVEGVESDILAGYSMAQGALGRFTTILEGTHSQNALKGDQEGRPSTLGASGSESEDGRSTPMPLTGGSGRENPHQVGAKRRKRS